MLHSRWFLAATMFVAPVLAQQPAAPIIPPETAAPDGAEAEVQKLNAQYNKALQEYYKPWREARAKKQPYKFDPSRHPRNTYAPKIREVALRYAGSDAAVDAWIVYLRVGGDRNEALTVLMRDHIKSKKMTGVIGYLRRGAGSQERLATLIEETPHRDVKGYGLLTYGEALLRANDPKAERVLAVVQEKYGDVPIWGGRSTAGKKAAGDLFEARNLTVGKTTPEIEAEDIDGVVFKLSDYRGKVVFLDFWGDW